MTGTRSPFLSLFHQVMGVKSISSAMKSSEPSAFLSLFHQVMGVKTLKKTKGGDRYEVSIPFSSGHGGKGANRLSRHRLSPVSIPFSSGHGGKVKGGDRYEFQRVVSIPFSSGHGGKVAFQSRPRRSNTFLSLFHQVMGVKARPCWGTYEASCFYPFFIRSWG